ncbi:curli production assembly/transport component CsgG domain protein [Leptospira fainei serovar Hurstbridge str. BUT 6]|uniref:Curli production assembly/transport component CsgG domain protein n=1 Tax=Leptospira fainei serovar Hurstbridge str. BUT 6 TaxID=1193011 RepID=S3W3B4_9LEPT|nr:CsgG/HfaB family protein [Leptospira fainei]EPG74782.1 curli production assembly/transport component CsgG domain protein [Leptospira fainei serovar Hurstbridge str. BUT 6]
MKLNCFRTAALLTVFLSLIDCKSAQHFDVQVIAKSGISQPGKDKYVVFPFEMAEGLKQNEAVANRRKNIEARNREKAELALVKTGLTVLERSKVDKLLNEMTFGKTGVTESDGLNIGKLLNSNFALFGKITNYNVARRGVRVRFMAEVIVKAVDIESGVIAWEAILKGHMPFNNGEQTILDAENTMYELFSKKLTEL